MNNTESKLFAQRLNHALDLREYPTLGRGRVNYIQEIFGISRAGANKWLHGKVIPHPKKRAEIASKLKINLKWLEQGEGSPLENDDSLLALENIVHHIPLLTMQQIHKYKSEIPQEGIETLVVNNQIPKSSFAVIHVGSSMEPRFSDNCILIIDPNSNISDGDYVIAETSVMPEAIFRQYIRGSENNYLTAINARFEIITINKSTTIIGKVIEVRSTL
jgi:phage repressor protein C with HTH and peptisase S24 domain